MPPFAQKCFLGVHVFSFANNSELGHLEGTQTIHGWNLYMSAGVVERVSFSQNDFHGNGKPCKNDQLEKF